MSYTLSRIQLSLLIAGDALFLLAVTFLGFATHNSSLAGGRWLATYLPLLLSWYLAAFLLGLYQAEAASQYRMIWLVFAAAVFAAPLAVMLRGLWLQQTVLPIFGLVMMTMTAAGMGVWRLVWVTLATRRAVPHG